MLTDPSLDTWTTLFLLIAAQGFFLSFLLFSKRTTESVLMGAICFLFSWMMATYVAFWTGYLQVLPQFFKIGIGFTFLIAPLYFFRVRGFDWKKICSRWYHILPFLTFAIGIQFNLGLYLAVFQNLHLFFYSLLILKKTRTDENAYLGFSFSFHLYYIMLWTGILTPEYDYMVSFSMAVFIYYQGLKLVIRPARPIHEVTHVHKDLFGRVSERILQEKLFLENELSLTELARKTGFTYHQLSEAINLAGGKNYHDYLNEFRVREAKRLLLDQNATVISIAYAAGFNNKVSFFKAFKKSTGMTPGEWKQKHTNEVAFFG